jgi:hypothetical protein
MTNRSCFKCGKPGRVQKYCPMNSAKGSKPQGGESRQQYPAQTQVYSLIPGGAEKDEEYTDATACTILLIDSIWLTINDLGLSHSFTCADHKKFLIVLNR